MPDQLQLRGGTTTEHNSFTGAAREVTVDTTKKTLVVHDGSQAGGTPLMKESGGNAASTVQIGVGGSNKLTINSDGHIDIASNLDCAAGLDVTGGGLTVNSGTTNTCATFTSTDSGAVVNITDSHTRSSIEQNNTDLKIISDTDAGDANSTIKFLVDNSTKMLINHLGNVGIGTTTIADDTDHCKLAISGQSGTAAGILIFQDASNNEDGMIFADNGNLYIAADRSNATADSNIIFRVDGSSEKMRIDSSGRVGIAQTPVSEKLEVSGAIRSTSASANFSAGAEAVFMDFIPSDRGRIGTITGTGSARDLAFNIGNLEKMRIGSNGVIGIGTTSPRDQTGIHLSKSGGECILEMQRNQTNTTGNVGIINFTASDGHSVANMGAFGDGDNEGADLVFKVTSAASANSPFETNTDERLRIFGSGGKLRATGVYNGTTTGGSPVYVESDGDLLRFTSSSKYKTDIETLEDARADNILNCRPVWYKSTCANDIKTEGATKSEWGWYGFIAEEVAKIDPRLVSWATKDAVTFKEGLKSVERDPSKYSEEGVRYDNFVPLLVNLLKRQKSQIEVLETKVAALEAA